MTVLVAVPESPEGQHALKAAAEEAKVFGTNLVILNIGLRKLDQAALPPGVDLAVVERSGPYAEPADVVLDYLREHPEITRLVIGIKRRTPIGKAVFGSVSQRLLLDSPVPVLAVKPDSDAD